jgi:hypothetical protein
MIALGQQPGNYEAIATIIAFAAENGKSMVFIIVLQQPFITGHGGALHKINRRNGFVTNGVFVPGPDLFGSKNLHPEN